METINTRIGEISFSEENIIYFPWGIIGFPESKRFLLVDGAREKDFKWLQSIDEPDLTFVTTNPYSFLKDYNPNFPESIFVDLEIEDSNNILLLNIVKIPENPREMTANLMAPIIVNTPLRKARQIILDDDKYNTKHYILTEIMKDKAKEQEG